MNSGEYTTSCIPTKAGLAYGWRAVPQCFILLLMVYCRTLYGAGVPPAPSFLLARVAQLLVDQSFQQTKLVAMGVTKASKSWAFYLRKAFILLALGTYIRVLNHHFPLRCALYLVFNAQNAGRRSNVGMLSVQCSRYTAVLFKYTLLLVH